VNHPNDELQFLRDLVEEHASIAGDVLQIGNNLWAIHGYIPVDCDVLLAEFDSYDQAANTLTQLSPRSRRRDDSYIDWV
jgi:hypothetical protein